MNIRTMGIESDVRSYSRSFPDVFISAQGSKVTSISKREYIDFLSACGGLNYGHNDPTIQDALIRYLTDNGISMSMDMSTVSKEQFLNQFKNHILKPRSLDYKVQFSGPTGTNAVEAAIKLARKVTGRTNVIAFTNAFHGCTLGALALTGNQHHRQSSSSLLNQVTRHPYDGYLGCSVDTVKYLDQLLDDGSSGVDRPAAIIVECIQGEGGLNVAGRAWLMALRKLATKHGTLLIVDDVQAGCGRRGTFFSFENQGFEPDIIVLAKSLSGYGLPLSLVLIRPEFDAWQPGEHNGTFRGNNLGFVAATAALKKFWMTDNLTLEVRRKERNIQKVLREISLTYGFGMKGCGLMQGVETNNPDLSHKIRKTCFANGLIVETCGSSDSIIKILPPLTISDSTLSQGLSILTNGIEHAISTMQPTLKCRKPKGEIQN